MTHNDLKNLLAETAHRIAELSKQQQETGRLLRESQQETDRLLRESQQETDRLREQQQETGRMLRESQQETDRLLRESERKSDREAAELRLQLGRLGEKFGSFTEGIRESERKSDREAAELRLQLGRLGEKFGSFTEGMAFPSMKKLLRERFGLTYLAERSTVRKNGRSHEVDVFGYSNTDKNIACIVEVKSRLREESIEQMLRILKDFPEFYPEHRGKQLYGILAAVEVPENLRQRVLREGIYLARIHDETFELDVPPDFQPRSFQA